MWYNAASGFGDPDSFVNERFKVKGSICTIFQNLIQYRLSRFAEGVRDNGRQLDIRNHETVLQTILFKVV